MTQAYNLALFANTLNTSGQASNSGLQNNSITINGTSVALGGSITVSSGAFDAGTVMIFAQTNAPTGWTKLTNLDNFALRVVSGTASTGGSVAFTTAFAAGRTVDATTLSTSQIPSHTHGGGGAPGNQGNPGCSGPSFSYFNSGNTGATGGGGSHNHGLPSFAVQYVDVIRASKN